MTVVLAVATAITWPASALAVTDWDGDGVIDSDCRPLDPAVHPDALDYPDLAFEDTNCDGIDGDEANAYFVDGVTGNDSTNSGRPEAPFATIQRAINAARPSFVKSIYVATGTYSHAANQSLSLPADADGIRIYGGYVAGTWARTTATATNVTGQPQTALLDGATDVVFQLVTFSATRGSQASAYGIRAINGSEFALIRSTTTAGPGATGSNGSSASQPLKAWSGAPGNTQIVPAGMGGTPCDYAGTGGQWTQFGPGPDGGAGGTGGEETNDGENGQGGSEGGGGSPGGDGGPGGIDLAGDADNPAVTEKGQNGLPGASGAGGSPGGGGANDLLAAGAAWIGRPGSDGTNGGHGYGGGGGGGGAGDGAGWGWSAGAGGGQGGEGGTGGTRGTGGGFGGGSFGVYLSDSAGTVTDGSTVQAGAGGSGGNGGSGAAGGLGGDGGPGATTYDCPTKEGGNGGDGGAGGNGGNGGSGGGGAGGPSIGVARLGTSLATVRGDSTAAAGTPGSGGTGPGLAGEGQAGQSGTMLPASSPATDFDGDAIADSADACVDIDRHADINGDGSPDTDANGDGCADRAAALPDTDSDGIPDSADACSSTPAGSNDADADGCPDAGDPGSGGSSDGGTTLPSGSTPDTTPPALTAVAKRQRALAAKALVWSVRCDEACTYTATAMLGRKKLGRLTKRIAAATPTKLRLKLSRTAQGLLRKALRRRTPITVVLKTAATDAAGNRRAAKLKIIVKR